MNESTKVQTWGRTCRKLSSEDPARKIIRKVTKPFKGVWEPDLTLSHLLVSISFRKSIYDLIVFADFLVWSKW